MKRLSAITILAAALSLAPLSAYASAMPAGPGDSDLVKIIKEDTKSPPLTDLPAPPPQQPPADASAQPIPIPVNPPAAAADAAGTAGDHPVDDSKSTAVYEYGPEDCDFSINFPAEPEIMQRCEDNDPGKCHILTTYTHVFELQATVTFTTSCNPADKNAYDHYSGDVMRATLARIAKDRLEKFETSYMHYDVAKQAAVLGTIKTGDSDGIYISQLWIGRNSIFTVEAQMLGPDRDDSTKMYMDVLRTIRHKDWPLNDKGVVVIPPSAMIVDPPPAAETPAAGTPKEPAPDKKADKATDTKKPDKAAGNKKKIP